MTRGAPMTMVEGDLFPPTPRVLYSKAPLVQVTCQLRFPPILRIEKEVPADFQDKIRQAFPLFERVGPLLQQIPPEVLQAIGRDVNPVVYHFISEDRLSTVELTPQSLGFTTRSYKYWETFRADLRLSLLALRAVYQPSFFMRAGLRYQDLIDRQKLGLDQVPWSKLLRTELIGELAIKELEDNVLGASRTLHVRMPSGRGTVLLRHGFGVIPGQPQTGYVIDLDFSTEQKTEATNVEHVLSGLHEEVGRAFRWCITRQLHDALGPTEPNPDELDRVDPH